MGSSRAMLSKKAITLEKHIIALLLQYQTVTFRCVHNRTVLIWKNILQRDLGWLKNIDNFI